MNGATLATIAPPGCFGVQEKRAPKRPRVGKIERAIVGRLGRVGDRAQIGQFEAVADLVEQAGAENFHRDDDRRADVALREIGIRADRHCRDIGGLAEEVLHQDSAAARICQVLAVDQGNGMNRHCPKLAAQQSDDWRDLGRYVAGGEIGGVRMGVFDAVVGADDGHDPELKPCQPLADPLFGPLRIEGIPNLDGGARGRGDALDEAHRMQTVLLDRLRKQLPFSVESHFIGAPGRGQHRDDDAHDRHNDNDADRHD